jgi:hypothetical protein
MNDTWNVTKLASLIFMWDDANMFLTNGDLNISINNASTKLAKLSVWFAAKYQED